VVSLQAAFSIVYIGPVQYLYTIDTCTDSIS